MPSDVDAVVLGNTRLSSDYSVLALDAPAIAAAARPGQFVMLKTSRGMDPLLRRPFSIFEILRTDDGSPRGITILNKRIGKGTGLLYGVEAGARLDCLGPLGRPFEPVDPPAQAWMVAGGVGLAPFVTLAEALIAKGTGTTLFYGARRAGDLHCADIFERLGARLVVSTEDGSLGTRGLITAPLGEALAATPASQPVRLYVCGPTAMMRAVAALSASHGRPCDVSLEQVMGCGMGGCYSCVVPLASPRASSGDARAEGPHHTRSCIDGPVFDATRIVWDALAH
jgi:dihydroorotate dehydrogenase electron transfer subunit